MVTLWKSSTTPIAERCSPHHAICLLSYFITRIVKSSKRKLFLTVWFNSLGKYAKMRLSEVHIFIGQKRFFFVEKIPKHYFKIIFAQKQKMKELPFLDQNHSLTPLESMQNCYHLKCKFLQARNHSFLSKRFPNILSRFIVLPKNKNMEKNAFLTNIIG